MKETKKENRIFVKNPTGNDDIVCEFVLCTFNLVDRVVIEAVAQRCSVKNVFLEISQNSQ